jgi:hypothetical protein
MRATESVLLSGLCILPAFVQWSSVSCAWPSSSRACLSVSRAMPSSTALIAASYCSRSVPHSQCMDCILHEWTQDLGTEE